MRTSWAPFPEFRLRTLKSWLTDQGWDGILMRESPPSTAQQYKRCVRQSLSCVPTALSLPLAPLSPSCYPILSYPILSPGTGDQDVQGPCRDRTARPQDGLLHAPPPGNGQRAPLRPQHGQQRGRPAADPSAPLLGDLRGVRGQAPAVQSGRRVSYPAKGVRRSVRRIPQELGVLQFVTRGGGGERRGITHTTALL